MAGPEQSSREVLARLDGDRGQLQADVDNVPDRINVIDTRLLVTAYYHATFPETIPLPGRPSHDGAHTY